MGSGGPDSLVRAMERQKSSATDGRVAALSSPGNEGPGRLEASLADLVSICTGFIFSLPLHVVTARAAFSVRS